MSPPLAIAGSPLADHLLAHGAARDLSGNTPLSLDNPEVLHLVERGMVELFLVGRVEGGFTGARHHFATITRGGLLPPALRAGEDVRWTLLAVAHGGTRVIEAPIASLDQAATRPDQREDLILALESWVRAVTSGLARAVSPKPPVARSIGPAETAVIKAGERFTARGGVIWLEAPSASLLFLDTQDLPGGEAGMPYPLSPEGWVLATDRVTVRGLSTGTVLDRIGPRPGLDALHAILFDTAEMNLRLADVDEHNRLTARVAATERMRDHSLRALMSVVDVRLAGRDTTTPDASPLVAALRIIGARSGFQVRLPPAASTVDPPGPPDLEALAEASGFRLRDVNLADGWWTRDFGALLGQDRDTGAPLALLSVMDGPPEVHDPGAGRRIPWPEARDRVARRAREAIAALPSHPLTLTDLMRSALPRGWRDALVALSAAAAGGVIGMAVPIATGHMVDTIIPAHDRDRLVELGLVLVALALASFVMRYVGAIAFTRFEGHAGSQTQAAAMDRLFRLPMTFFRDYSSGDLASRVMALTQARAMVSSAAASAIMGGVFSLFSFGLMFQYSVTLALWATGATLVYLLLTLGFGYARLRQERPLATLRGEGEGLLLQLLAGIAKIRLSASEDRAFARWTANFVEVRRRFVRASLFGALQGALNAVFSLASLFLFINVGKDAVGGQAMIAVGAFAAFLNAFQSFNASATQLAQVAIQLVAIRPLMERMAPILATPVEESKEKDPPGPLSGAVEASGVTFRYGPGQPTVLENVSLSIQSGEFVAFVGPSGSGKSTLTRLILGFEEPESGGILFDGKDLRSLDATAVRRAMGVVPQHPQPMPGSLFENIVGVGEGSLDDAWDAAERAGLAEDIRRMPMGMHTIIPEGGGVLSGGQIQRLMIARVLFNRPRIILLDEATSALDNRTQAIVTESLTRLSVTRIVVAHRLSTVMTADRIHVFEGGRVVETGTYSELMAHGGLFSRLAERQIA